MVTAYSYVRFSTKEQAKGDSLRRQTEATADWCRRNGAHLDTSTTLRDLGKSAFKGKHRTDDKAALAGFLKLARAGGVPKGSYLVIENLDRLSREDERTALRLWMDILDAGINIVQLTPETVFRHERSDMFDIMRAIMELSRGHGESKRKSDLVGAAWAEKKRNAGKEVLTQELPSWLRVAGRRKKGEKVVEAGRIVADEAKVEVVRTIFRWAAEGLGARRIKGRLNDGKVRPISGCDHWTLTYIGNILNNRAVLGEYQPHTKRGGKRQPDGKPVQGYYPAVVAPELWAATRRSRRPGRPRTKGPINVFSGLLKDFQDGKKHGIIIVDKGERKGGMRLVPYQAHIGEAKHASFPLDVFERAIFSQLREVRPSDVFPAEDHSRVRSVEARLADAESEVAKLKESLRKRYSEAVAEVLADREVEAKALAAELEAARAEAASPPAAALKELIECLGSDEDRLQLRAALRRAVRRIDCLFAVEGWDRLAVVRVAFAGGAERWYTIKCRPQSKAWSVRSLRSDEMADPLCMTKEGWALSAEALRALILAHEANE
jgi:DNA invertase Pin-like site-specific DNA recombinase